MRIISLSTIPPRFATLGLTLESLVSQSGAIDEILLYIPKTYRRFPDYDGSLPSVPDGVKIVRPDCDLGPASKVLFAAREFRNQNAQLLFCDDDKIFSRTWSESLFNAQSDRPGECVALIGKPLLPNEGTPSALLPKAVRAAKSNPLLRARRIYHKFASAAFNQKKPRPMRNAVAKAGYVDILQGVGGAVVRPEFFDEIAFDIPDVIWAVDDVWLSGMLALKNIPIWLPAKLNEPDTTKAHDVASLYRATIEGSDRNDANTRCIRYMQERYGIWL